MVQGRGIDAPLNALGAKQAQLFYDAYRHESFDKIYISELQRTFQTVASFIDIGIPYEKLSGLDEISWGDQEGQPFNEHTSRLYHDTVQRWRQGFLHESVGGGESPEQVMLRQRKAFKQIMEKTEEKRVLICMHGRAMRILLSWLTGRSLSQMDDFEHTNLGLYELHMHAGEFKLIRSNDTKHLKF